MQEWKRNNKPQLSVMPEKGGNVSAMEIVEDFVYFISSASKSNLQVINIFSEEIFNIHFTVV